MLENVLRVLLLDTHAHDLVYNLFLIICFYYIMSNTNTKTGKEGSIDRFFKNITNSLYYSRPLDIATHNGVYGIPYAVIGMVTLVSGIFVYVTYNDYANEMADTINQETDNMRQDLQFEESFVRSRLVRSRRRAPRFEHAARGARSTRARSP